MKTTSLIQSFDLTGYQTSDTALIVRPPQNMRVFRAQIIITSALVSGDIAACFVANVDNANILSAIYLSNENLAQTTTVAPPGLDTTRAVFGTNRLLFDRRGVGYMQDTFYIWDATGAVGAGVVNFIWECEID